MQIFLSGLVVVLTFALGGAAVSQKLDLPIAPFEGIKGPPPPKSNWGGAVFNKPLYNPETKSYFEYHFPAPNLEHRHDYQFNWEAAQQVAERRVYKGVRGRLAVIKTDQTNDFIVKNFKPQDGTWIGLQYFCQLRALRWVTGEFWPLEAYHNWGRVWNVQGTVPAGNHRATCLPYRPWMGIHYWGPNGHFKWNANGTAKEFSFMIIEYPTGKP